MNIEDLKPLEKNCRKIKSSAIKNLKKSIQNDPEYMLARPLIVNMDGVVIGGNQRLRCLIELGHKVIPDNWVKRVDWTENESRRFSVVDNAPVGMSGEFDFDLLADQYELSFLVDVGFEAEYFNPPDFEPGTEDEQGKLDQLEPKMETCPECGLTFDLREHGQG